jgi:cysteine-rich repeat protein
VVWVVWTGEVATSFPALTEPYGCPYDLDDVNAFTGSDGTLYVKYLCYPYDLLGTVDASTSVVTTIGLTPEKLMALAAETCGNGTREGGEECDDGNTIAGDCCSPTCRFDAAGSSCADDGSPCTTEACDGAGSCVHTAAPPVGCVAGSPGRSTLSIIGGADPRLSWKWRGTIDTVGAFGVPTAATDVTLCLADGSSALLVSATAPANGVCQSGQPCWKPSGGGYVYRDLARTPQGIEKMSLGLSPTPGKAKLKVKARGPYLPIASLPYTTPLTGWLTADDGGGCWTSTFSSTRRNDVKKLKAISD